MFDTVLVANRGEIAVRVLSTLRRLGIRSVAVYSDADRESPHVRAADEAVRIGPAAALESYLNMERILDAARDTGAQAIHPGYGFLSENASFVRACEDAGVIFVGPSADAVEVMGDKIRAKLAVAGAGVPVVPGRSALGMTNDDLVAAAAEIGYPVLVKPSAGGGGKGMRLVGSADALGDALISARREAAASFGDDTLFLERYVARPRHIEVQILADSFGTTVHLGERECSLQRRHQKVMEEAPSTLLDAATRTRITASAVMTAQSVAYRGAGTVEFIVSADAPDEFYFMEMNTRLQVEHPVTEMVTGLDLVEQQLRVAAGERLAFAQEDLRSVGHSVEARIYAEDPTHGFVPTGGRVMVLREPHGEGIRVDSSLAENVVISSHYDPMLAKVIAYGPDRSVALARLDRALATTVVLGVVTNIGFLRSLLRDADVRAGALDTELIERGLDRFVQGGSIDSQVSLELCAAFALSRIFEFEPRGAVVDRWDVPDGWRIGERAHTRWSIVTSDASRLEISLAGPRRDARIDVLRSDPRGIVTRSRATCALYVDDAHRANEFFVTVEGRTSQIFVVSSGDVTWVWMNGVTHALHVIPPTRTRGDSDGVDGEIRSPMPGVVIELNVERNAVVSSGDRLVVIEAMKMEHALTAPFSGSVGDVFVAVGDQVSVNQRLLNVEPVGEEGRALTTEVSS